MIEVLRRTDRSVKNCGEGVMNSDEGVNCYTRSVKNSDRSVKNCEVLGTVRIRTVLKVLKTVIL